MPDDRCDYCGHKRDLHVPFCEERVYLQDDARIYTERCSCKGFEEEEAS